MRILAESAEEWEARNFGRSTWSKVEMDRGIYVYERRDPHLTVRLFKNPGAIVAATIRTYVRSLSDPRGTPSQYRTAEELLLALYDYQ